MNRLEEMVREFHTKYGYKQDGSLHDEYSAYRNCDALEFEILQNELEHIAIMLRMFAERLKGKAVTSMTKIGDNRPYRAHLMLEELAEALQAMSRGDEVKTADGLTDLLYVVIGTFITLGLPMSELMEEVHRSNMTKTRFPTDDRMKSKGVNYDPPLIGKVLREHKENAVSVARTT